MKNALVLTGGGSKGAFQAGALKHLIADLNNSYQIISGVSAGALNASFLSQYHHEDALLAAQELEMLWNEIDTKKVYKNWPVFRRLSVLWKNGLYNNQPLQELIKSKVSMDKIKQSNVYLNIESVNVNTGERRVSNNNSEHLFKAIIASAAVPFFFEPVEVLPGEYDFDGGLRDFAPLKEVLKQNPDHITIITTDPLFVSKVEPKKMHALDIITRVLEIYGDETVRNDIDGFVKTNEYIKNGATIPGKRYIPYTLITPKTYITKNALKFDPNEISNMLEIGYNTACTNAIKG